MTSPGLQRSPNSDGELLRDVLRRLRRLEEGSTARVGKHVLTEDPLSGHAQIISEDGTVTPLTRDPIQPEEVIAGVAPGVFATYRASVTPITTAAGFQWFPNSWFDTLENSSDRLIYDPLLNELTCDSTAVLLINLQCRVASTVGSRGWRITLGRKRASIGETGFTIIRQSPSQWQSSNHIITGGTWMLPVVPGDVLKPGFYATESASNTFTGDPDPSYTRWEVGRIIDL